MIVQRLDQFFEFLLRRLGRRYLAVLRASVLVIIVVVADSLVGLVLFVHLDPTSEEFTRIMLVSNAVIIAVGLVWLAPTWRRIGAPIEAVLAGRREPDVVLAAWRAVQTFALDHLRVGVQAGVVALLLATVYGTWDADFTLLEALVAIFAQLIVLGFITAVAWPVIELASRPIRRLLAPLLPRDVVVERAGPALGLRVTLSIVGISLVTSVVVAIVATLDGTIETFGGLLLVSTAVTVTFGGLLALLLSGSLLAPLDDLLTTARRVAAGRLDQRVDVTSSDEIGEVAGAFNEMLDAIERSSAEVRASRERIVAASDAERRRIERNIHDGAQQHLVALALRLRALEARLADDPAAAAEAAAAVGAAQSALGELRDLAQGLHPSILTSDGLAAAFELLADRAPVPVTVSADPTRFPEIVESTAWFVASEALANVGKYAQATAASVSAVARDGNLVVEVADDGVGGALLDKGSGLRGLTDRVEAVGGTLSVDSRPGVGTTIIASLPLAAGVHVEEPSEAS
ncbi:MAG: HAMP domain-containing protein [Nitriliruptorales bacterium]|nr:HAMP domain-containing protein [Nitriliruptorales bacterium]